MNKDQIKRNVVKSTLSGYARLLVRIGLGLVTFRLLYQGLTPEQFGFWSLLWAIFGYGVLLDFGFGYAAQKRVAELMIKQDWHKLSEVMSTIFYFYLAAAAVALLLGVIFSSPLIDLFKVTPEHRAEYERIMMIFMAGIGLAFPLGIFPEVLQGQQRITTANNLGILSTVANFGVVLCVVWFKLSFTALVVLSLLCVLVPCLLAAKLAFEVMPGVRLRPGLCSRATLFQTGKFGLFAYANTLSNVLRNKADQPVISAILGVSAVTPYQAGAKVGEMFGYLTRQIADVLSPTAAHLHAKGDAPALRQMLVSGMRYSVLAATPLYILSAAYMEGIIRLLTGVRQPTPEMLWTGQLLLFWYYSLVMTHWVYKRMFMMAGQERRMMWQGVIEAAANLALSISLTLWMKSILGVALGSVIPTFLLGWGLLWGWASKEAGVSRTVLFVRVVLRPWAGCLPMLALAAALRFQPWWASGSSTWLMLLEASAVAGVGMVGIWQFSLSREERARFGGRFRQKLRRQTKGHSA